MDIEIVKIEKENGGFSIWIDREQDFRRAEFLKEISILNIDEHQIIYESFCPAEIIEKYSTKIGDFFISQEFDEFAGTTIYSKNAELMNKLYKLMLSSGNYQVK